MGLVGRLIMRQAGGNNERGSRRRIRGSDGPSDERALRTTRLSLVWVGSHAALRPRRTGRPREHEVHQLRAPVQGPTPSAIARASYAHSGNSGAIHRTPRRARPMQGGGDLQGGARGVRGSARGRRSVARVDMSGEGTEPVGGLLSAGRVDRRHLLDPDLIGSPGAVQDGHPQAVQRRRVERVAIVERDADDPAWLGDRAPVKRSDEGSVPCGPAQPGPQVRASAPATEAGQRAPLGSGLTERLHDPAGFNTHSSSSTGATTTSRPSCSVAIWGGPSSGGRSSVTGPSNGGLGAGVGLAGVGDSDGAWETPGTVRFGDLPASAATPMPIPAAATARASSAIRTRTRAGAGGGGPGWRPEASGHRSGAATWSTRCSVRRRSVIVGPQNRPELRPSATEVDGQSGRRRPPGSRRPPATGTRRSSARRRPPAASSTGSGASRADPPWESATLPVDRAADPRLSQVARLSGSDARRGLPHPRPRIADGPAAREGLGERLRHRVVGDLPVSGHGQHGPPHTGPFLPVQALQRQPRFGFHARIVHVRRCRADPTPREEHRPARSIVSATRRARARIFLPDGIDSRTYVW